MKKLLMLLYLLTVSTLAIAQNNSDYYVITNTDTPDVSTTTTFSVEIPNDDVGLVVQSLCYSTGRMDDCNSDKGKQVVIEFIKEKINQYVASQTNSPKVDIK